jgi:transposase InsO family protein
MNNTTLPKERPNYAPEVRQRAVRMVLDHQDDYPSRWAAVCLQTAKGGKPTQTGYVESFNGKMRDELLNETLFFSLDHARSVVATLMEDYNTIRPLSTLANQTPAAYAEKFAATGYQATPLRGSACQPVAQPAQPIIQRLETLTAAG